MQQRRKKIASGESEVVRNPSTGTYCEVCFGQGLREFQVMSPSGITCKFGHGGAGSLNPADYGEPNGDPTEFSFPPTTSAGSRHSARESFKEDFQRSLREGHPAEYATDAEVRGRLVGDPAEAAAEEEFEIRAGDTLTIKFDGANLQIAPYSSVSLDSAIYSRKLEEGDDPEAEFDRIYAYLKRKCLGAAVSKLNDFADEHRKARERAGTR